MPTPTVQFAHGVASGDPYADSVILWTRITPPAAFEGSLDVQWEIADNAQFSAGSIKASGSLSTSAARDWTVKVEAGGLEADRTYHYRFRAGETLSPVGSTKTLPVGSDPVRLAVFSCTNFPAAERFAAYGRAAAINNSNPYDAWLHLGDYIYEYGPGGYGAAEDAAGSRGFLPNREVLSLSDYRQRYAQYHTDPDLQALRAAAPLIAIWDDHETANDSWKGGAENHQSATEGDWIARRDAALQAYYEWIPIREPGLRQSSDGSTASSPLAQGYRSFNFGDVLALHMLETRLIARDEQLKYPDAVAVQARIGAILGNPALVASYATKAGIAPPASPAAIPAFANALAPLVTQELVIATVQQAWADPSRRMIGATQMAWLQKQMATSTAAWQVLGQQVLMESMAVPAELLLNAGNPALLDKYAAPLQKLATGTPFTSLSPAEQALFAERAKIPYNLDAWDGYGVERETILQTALSLGKRLISLAGDTHNAWAGVLDTMSAGSKPAGSLAGVEFGTPGVTSPGFEKYLPGADSYIRTNYPAVDGLDGLFLGYVNGLKYADLNRRGFLDLTITPEQAIGSFQFLNGIDPVRGSQLWSSEAVISSNSYAVSGAVEARPVINWQAEWQELDLNFGLARLANDQLIRLDPATFASVPREGVQLADVTVHGSEASDLIVAGIGSVVDADAGQDVLDNSDSAGANLLIGGTGSDTFVLRAAADTVIGGSLQPNGRSLGLPAVVALVDGSRDTLLIDSSNPAPEGSLRILDYELGRDTLLLDGIPLAGTWTQIKAQLQALNISVNAAPEVNGTGPSLILKRGLQVSQDFAALVSDADGDGLALIKLEGPAWITTSGTTLLATAPTDLTDEQLAAVSLRLGFSDGKAIVPFTAELGLNIAPSGVILTNTITSLAEDTKTTSRIKLAEIAIIDDALGSNTLTLAGPDAESFELIANQLFLRAGTSLNFETKAVYSLTISASDPLLPNSTPVSSTFTLVVSDTNEAPTGITFSNTVNHLSENNSTANNIKVADISIQDDAIGNNVLSLTGADASSFELIGKQLYLRAATTLDYETKGSYSLTVTAADPSLPESTAASQPFVLKITNINEDSPNSDPYRTTIAIPTPTGDREIIVNFQGGTLLSNTNLRILRDLDISPTSLRSLAELGITRNNSGIDLQLDVDPDQDRVTLSTALDLIASDLIPQLSDFSGRLPNRKLLYFALNSATGATTPLMYDPITGAGARFFDLNNDGTADFFTLGLIDGGYGDKDGVVNGRIDDPSFAGFADLNNLAFKDAGAGTLTVRDTINEAPATVVLKATLNSRSNTSNQLGYIVLSPSEAANSSGLVSDLSWLRGRAQTLFSTLESSDVVLPGGIDFDREIAVINGQSLMFFEVANGTLDQLTSLADNRFRYLSLAELANRQASFSSASGVRLSLSVLIGDPSLNSLISQNQSSNPVLNLSAFGAAQVLTGSVVLGREADFNSTAGFYRTLDAAGRVLGSDGITLISPGDSGYAAAALRSGNTIGSLGRLSVGDNQVSSRSFTVDGSNFIAPFAQVNGNTFFAFAPANSDGISHFRSLGTNIFGFEDQFGGGDRDFDDLVIGFSFSSVA